MSDSDEEHVGESSGSQRRSKKLRQCNRHTTEQIQQLEAFFKECPHPDENQRNQLSREAGLDPKQIKFWFQNKRTQTKTQNERSDNNTLRSENEKYHCENMAMKEALKNIYCPRCDGPPPGEEERQQNIEKMKMENQKLREEHDRISKIVTSVIGRSFMNPNLTAPPISAIGSSSNSSEETLLSQHISDSPTDYPPPPPTPPTPPAPHQENNNNNNNVRENSININNIPTLSSSPQENHTFLKNKSVIFEIVIAAMDEMVEILQVNDPMWVKSSTDDREFIHRATYERIFPNPNRPHKSATARIESSRYVGVVPMTAIELIQNFIDPVKWMNMFPTIVTKAKTIEVLDSENLGGSIQLMYEKIHVLSPLVGSRDFFFIRCCRQLDLTTWLMVDISYDVFKEVKSGAPSFSWKFPSGCIIQDMGNGQSLVTWMEHIQVDEQNQVHRMYRDLLCGRQTFGAKRWVVTLQRMSERYNFAMGATSPVRHDLKGVINDPEGLKNVMQLSQRMVKSFCENLSMTDKMNSPSSTHLSSGDRVCIRKNEEITQPKGHIVTASTSLWFPLPFEAVFNFFSDDKARNQWDILTLGDTVTELARILTGIFPGNAISIIQPHTPKDKNNMLLLQETSIDEMGAFVIYAPIDLPRVNAIIHGDDAKKVPILPSGFIISPDGRVASDKDYNGNNAPNGSILTVAFQVLICDDVTAISQQQQMDAVVTVHRLLSTTALKIKAALDGSD